MFNIKKILNKQFNQYLLKENDLLIITGSLYLAGEMLNLN